MTTAWEGTTASDYIIETVSLGKTFKGFRAVQDINLKVRRNSIHALIGPNGAGKTTVFNLITKFHTPTTGKILLDGRDVTSFSPAALARQGMGRSFQISSIFSSMTVLENVRISLQRKTGLSLKFWLPQQALHPLHERADELIEYVGLADYRNIQAASLSYGRKRALELATTVAMDPEVLLLDEPMAGMGYEDIEQTTDVIRRISADRTILMVEHNLSVVADLSHFITVMTRGEILAEGKYHEVAEDPRVREAYIGGANNG